MDQPAYALVTGASSGIGEHFARALAARRRNLLLVARSRAKLESLAEELRRAHGVLAEALPFDLSAPGAAEALAAALGERGIEVDLLVNNAGFGRRGEFARLALDRQSEMIRLNVHAVVELTHRLLAPMMAKRRGAIINVSSTASFQPVPWTTVYAATKASSWSRCVRAGRRRTSSRPAAMGRAKSRVDFSRPARWWTRRSIGSSGADWWCRAGSTSWES